MDHREKPLFSSGPAKRPAYRLLLVPVVLILLGGIGFVSFRAAGNLMPRGAVLRDPLTARVELKRGVTKSVLLTGNVQLPVRGVVTAPETGVVDSIAVRGGERLDRGRELLRISSAELEEQRRSLEQDLSLQTRQLEWLRSSAELKAKKERLDEEIRRENVSRAEESLAEKRLLAEAGLVGATELREAGKAAGRARSGADQERAAAELATGQASIDRLKVEAEVTNLRSRLESIERRLASCRITSPSPMIVTALGPGVKPGAFVARYQVLLEYAVPDPVEAVFSLPEILSGSVEPGAPMNVTIDGEIYPGVLGVPGMVSGDAGRGVSLGVRLTEAPERIIIGQKADARLTLEELPELLALPSGPWVSSGRLEYAYRVDGDTATKVLVRLSTDFDGIIGVLDGLEEGDEVIISSYDDLEEADTVRLER